MAKKDAKKEQEKTGKSLKAKFNDAYMEMKAERIKKKGDRPAKGGCGKGCDCGK